MAPRGGGRLHSSGARPGHTRETAKRGFSLTVLFLSPPAAHDRYMYPQVRIHVLFRSEPILYFYDSKSHRHRSTPRGVSFPPRPLRTGLLSGNSQPLPQMFYAHTSIYTCGFSLLFLVLVCSLCPAWFGFPWQPAAAITSPLQISHPGFSSDTARRCWTRPTVTDWTSPRGWQVLLFVFRK